MEKPTFSYSLTFPDGHIRTGKIFVLDSDPQAISDAAQDLASTLLHVIYSSGCILHESGDGVIRHVSDQEVLHSDLD